MRDQEMRGSIERFESVVAELYVLVIQETTVLIQLSIFYTTIFDHYLLSLSLTVWLGLGMKNYVFR